MAQESKATSILWPQEDLPKNSTLPAMELHLKNPKLSGQDTPHFSKLSWRAQANRKALHVHVECDRHHAADIRRLTQLAKEADLVSKKWGKHAHMREVVDKDSTPSEIKCLLKVAQTHTNNQCSMILENIVEITNLDGTTTVYDEETHNFLVFHFC